MADVVTTRTSDRPSPTDALLAARAASGDLHAFGVLVERHRGAVLRVTARMVGPDDAEDVTQDAFLRAFHRLDRLRDLESFRAWLMRIAQHAAFDALDRRRRKDDRRSHEQDAEPRDERTPARLLEERERRLRLAAKVGTLRPEHRVVLILRDLEGWSYEEIALATDSPLGSVKGRLHRARSELIDSLRRNGYDWELPDGS